MLPAGETTNPWQTIASKPVYENRAIGVLPLDNELNTYLVGQYRYTLGEYSWEIPEGGGAMDVDPIESAKRELEEETGLIAADWSILQKIHLSNSVSDEFGVVYLARELTAGPSSPEETEQLQVVKIPFAEAYRLVEENKITDSLSVAAILKVQLMINDGRIK